MLVPARPVVERSQKQTDSGERGKDTNNAKDRSCAVEDVGAVGVDDRARVEACSAFRTPRVFGVDARQVVVACSTASTYAATAKAYRRQQQNEADEQKTYAVRKEHTGIITRFRKAAEK